MSIHPSVPHTSSRFALLESVRRGRAATRADLGQTTGLSRSVVAQVVSELMAEGLLTEGRSERPMTGRSAVLGRRGRPSSVVRLAPQPGLAAGIDFGHQHITILICELDGTVLHEADVAYDVDTDARSSFAVAQSLLRTMMGELGHAQRRLIAVGLSLPFPVVGEARTVSPVGEVPGWAGVRPHELIGLEPGTVLVVDNDADAGAWGELIHDGESRSLLFVKVGEGLGSALAVGDAVPHGAHGMAGEIGHVLVPGSLLPCRCGSIGCLDAVVTRAVAHDATGAEIETAARVLGSVLAQVASFIDPDALVLGGTVGAEWGRFAERIAASYERHSSRSHHAPLRAAALGRRSEVHGALDRALHSAWSMLASPASYAAAR